LCSAYEEDEPTTEEADAKLCKKIARFTEPQRACMRAFLALVTVAPELAFHHEPIAHALSPIWA
jgi:hypothetical protein